jgi:hypothetical protein
MKKILFLVLPVVLTLFHGVTFSQNFQNNNSLRKSTRDTVALLKEIPKTDNIRFDTISIPATNFMSRQLELEKLGDNARKTNENAKGVLESLENSTLSVDARKEITDAANALIEKSKDLGALYDSEKKEKDPEQNRRLNDRIAELEKEVERKKLLLENATSNNKKELSKNKELTQQLLKITEEKKESENRISILESNLLETHKSFYFTTKELFAIQQNNLAEKSKALDTKMEEIKKGAEGLINWLDSNNISKDDKHIIGKQIILLSKQLPKLEEHQSALADQNKAYAAAVDTYNTYANIINSGLVITTKYITDSIDAARARVQVAQKGAKIAFDRLAAGIDGYANANSLAVQTVNPILEKYKKNEVKEQNFSAFGGFKKILEEDGAFIPDIAVFANKSFGSSSFGGYGQIRLFTGLNTDNAKYNTAMNYFVPEASSYGLAMDFGLGFQVITEDGRKSRNFAKNLKDLGFNTSFYLLGKKLRPTDSLTISSNVMQWRTGFEILPFQNFISLRINVNGLFISNKYTEITKFYTSSSDTKWFTDIALSALLDLNESKDNAWKLRFELDIIPINSDMKEFMKTTDKVLPQIKLELVKNF